MFKIKTVTRIVCALCLLAYPGSAPADTPARQKLQQWPFAKHNPLIFIKGGTHVFGSDNGEANEAPQMRISTAGFLMTRTEITNAQYRAYATLSGAEPAHYSRHTVLGQDQHPVVGISFAEAKAFCKRYGLRLPSEQEWERAARGTEGRRFAWGDEPPGADKANYGVEACCGPNSHDGYAASAPVGSYEKGQTPEGLADMSGNVWEWVDGWYTPDHTKGAKADKRFRVLKGGAWNSDPWRLRASYRQGYNGAFRYAANGGFRCVKDTKD